LAVVRGSHSSTSSSSRGFTRIAQNNNGTLFAGTQGRGAN
jgi:hypothetical protein